MTAKTVSIGVEWVTPEQADEYLKINFEHQRRVRTHHVAFLEREMQAERFVEVAEVCIVHVGDRQSMINGQHTCRAIIKHGKPERVTVRHMDAETDDDVAFLYSYAFDNGIKRTFGDGLGAYAMAELYDLKSKATDDIASALRHICAGFDWDKRDGGTLQTPLVDVIAQMPYWVDAYRTFAGLKVGSGGRVRKTAFKRAVLSVALVTLRYQPETATEFWTSGLTQEMLMLEDPRARLYKVLLDSIQAPSSNGKRTVDMPELSRLVALCWNKYFDGETMKRMPAIKKEFIHAPIVIAGSPFDGKQPKAPWWPDALGEAVDTASANTPVALTMPGKPVAKRIVTMQEWLEGTKRAA